MTYLLIHVVGTGVVGAWWGMTPRDPFQGSGVPDMVPHRALEDDSGLMTMATQPGATVRS